MLKELIISALFIFILRNISNNTLKYTLYYISAWEAYQRFPVGYDSITLQLIQHPNTSNCPIDNRYYQCRKSASMDIDNKPKVYWHKIIATKLINSDFVVITPL